MGKKMRGPPYQFYGSKGHLFSFRFGFLASDFVNFYPGHAPSQYKRKDGTVGPYNSMGSCYVENLKKALLYVTS